MGSKSLHYPIILDRYGTITVLRRLPRISEVPRRKGKSIGRRPFTIEYNMTKTGI